LFLTHPGEANIASSLRMFGKQSALQTSNDDSESHGFSFEAPQAKMEFGG
jgi:hypothetical protein